MMTITRFDAARTDARAARPHARPALSALTRRPEAGVTLAEGIVGETISRYIGSHTFIPFIARRVIRVYLIS